MHKEILTEKQKQTISLVKKFKNVFGLVGGTAIALHLGHRHSVDFDLYSNEKFDNQKIRKKIGAEHKIEHVFFSEEDEFTVLIDGVKFTFFHYDFNINFTKKFDDIIVLPDLISLAAMKAYALGMRAKWKDYVDLYFITKDHYSVSEISKKSKQIFEAEFNEKNFRTQLSYFKDIDHSEEVSYLPGFEVSDDDIKKALPALSLK